MASGAIKITDIILNEEVGEFRTDSEQIGFKGSAGTKMVYPGSELQVAEWLDGELRILFKDGTVLALKGFQPEHFDKLWKHFESYFQVYIRKRKQVVQINSADFDAVLRKIEAGADKVDAEKSGSVKKKSFEADLMKIVEVCRDIMNDAVSGDKQALSDTFSQGGCERIGRLRLIIDTIQLEMYHTDHRWENTRNLCASIESVLTDCGTFRAWKPSQDSGEAMLKRQMLRELHARQGGSFQDSAPSTEPEPVYQAPAPVQVPAAIAAMPPLQAPGSGGYAGPEGNKKLQGQLTSTNPLAKAKASTDIVTRHQEESDDDDGQEVPTPAARVPVKTNALGREEHKADGDCIKDGWLWKKSRHLKRWRHRWFKLTAEYLYSYKEKGSAEPTEQIQQGTVLSVTPAETETGQRNAFAINVQGRTYIVNADTEKDKNEWMEIIMRTLGPTK